MTLNNFECNLPSLEIASELRAFPEPSFPFSGLPLEYIVANFPSNMKRNQPFDPFESSNADDSDQM